MPGREKDEFLDLLYEAAYEPAGWEPALKKLGDMVGGNAVWLSELNVFTNTGGSEDDPMVWVDPDYLQRYVQYFWARNPIAQTEDPVRYLREWKLLVRTDEDCIARDELVRTEYYNDFLRPQHVGSVLLMRLARLGDSIAVLNVSRDDRRGRFDPSQMDWARLYHGDIIRAFNMSKKIGASRRRQRDADALLDLSPNSFFLLDGTGAIRHVNRAGEKLLAEASGLSVVHGKLRATKASVSKRLEALIAIAASPDSEKRRSGSMAIPSPKSALPLSVLVTPIGGHKFASIQTDLSVCVCVTDLSTKMQLPHGPLQNLFGLTDAEIRVAQALFEGANLHEIAALFGISHNTVRVQLGSIFDKTRTNRQADLIALLSRLSHVRAQPATR